MLCYFIHLQNLGRQVRSVGKVEAHSLRENFVFSNQGSSEVPRLSLTLRLHLSSGGIWENDT